MLKRFSQFLPENDNRLFSYTAIHSMDGWSHAVRHHNHEGKVFGEVAHDSRRHIIKWARDRGASEHVIKKIRNGMNTREDMHNIHHDGAMRRTP